MYTYYIYHVMILLNTDNRCSYLSYVCFLGNSPHTHTHTHFNCCSDKSHYELIFPILLPSFYCFN